MSDSAPIGRPTLLNVEVMNTLVGYVRGGAWFKVAAMAVGVSPRTLIRWMKKGRLASQARLDGGELADEDVPFVTLYSEIMQAAAQARVVVEANAAQRYPLKWLRRGPGAWLDAQAKLDDESTIERWEDDEVVELDASDAVRAALSARVLEHAKRKPAEKIRDAEYSEVGTQEPVTHEAGGYVEGEGEADADFAEMEGGTDG